MVLPNSSNKSAFINTFNGIARHKHRYAVFSDFVLMSAIAIHNAVNPVESLEAEYMEIVGRYSKGGVNELAKLLGILIELLESEPTDVLGQLYMELELGNSNTGQFFTPSSISELMAQITMGDELKEVDKPFVTLSEPACGAGGMVLAFAKMMIANGHNPAVKLWVQCTDLDRVAAMMCYLQLSLWNIPAQIIVGNTLSMEYREQYFTPAHYTNGWDEKLRFQRMIDFVLELEAPEQNQSNTQPTESEEPKRRLSTEGGQLDLF